MKVHIMTVGFTPRVFTTFEGLAKLGADKIIAINSDNEHVKVQETIRALKSLVKDTKSLQIKYVTKGKTFLAIVQELLRTINAETTPDDEVFVHIGGGERHLALALLYATFFCNDRKMKVVCTTRILEGKNETLVFNHEIMPTMPLNLKLSKSQAEVMKALEARENSWKSLTELSKLMGGKKEKTMPRIHRHLKNLQAAGLVEKDEKTRKHRLTTPGQLALEAVKSEGKN